MHHKILFFILACLPMGCAALTQLEELRETRYQKLIEIESLQNSIVARQKKIKEDGQLYVKFFEDGVAELQKQKEYASKDTKELLLILQQRGLEVYHKILGALMANKDFSEDVLEICLEGGELKVDCFLEIHSMFAHLVVCELMVKYKNLIHEYFVISKQIEQLESAAK